MSSFILFVYSLSPLFTVIRSSGEIVYLSPLHVEGRYIKDVLNNTIYLRGVNWEGYNDGTSRYGNWPEPGSTTPLTRYSWDDARPRAHYRVLRDEWGANAMRWLINIQDWLENTAAPTPENPTAGYRDHIRRGIELAQEYGIYIILAPWRVQGGTDWNNDPLPYPPYTHTGTSIIADQQAFIDFWVSVATELRDLPNWLIDPYNEPHMVTGATHDTDRATWFDVISRLIPAVRNVSDHIILVQWMEGVWWWLGYNNMGSWVDPFINYLEARNATSNIVISTHNYHDAFTYWGGRPNDLPQLLEDYTYAGLVHAATEITYPLIIGEIGMQDFGDRTAEEIIAEQIWFTNALTLFNNWGIGYVGWMWGRQGDRAYALLSSGPWIPPPSESGQILFDAINRGRA